MASYVIAVKREARADVPSDWRQRLERIPGVKVVGSGQTPTVRVEAEPEALEEIRRAVGGCCHIEPVILHRPS